MGRTRTRQRIKRRAEDIYQALLHENVYTDLRTTAVKAIEASRILEEELEREFGPDDEETYSDK